MYPSLETLGLELGVRLGFQDLGSVCY